MPTLSSPSADRAPSPRRTNPRTPTPLLALVAAAIVAAFDRSWLARPVCELAETLGERPERISRLKAALLAIFERALRRATRPGPSPPPPPDRDHPRVRVLEALLGVAAEAFASLKIRKREVQDRLVAARDRLRREHGVSHDAFAAALGLPARTVRHWAARPPRPAREPEPPAPERTDAPTNEGRFDLTVTLPGLQAMADTTDWSLFGQPLKIVGLQDPGERDTQLLGGFSVADHEDHRVVVEVVERTLGDRPGAQLLTDQGTPYLAEAARQAYERMELDHAPQKEACPTAKAPLERAWRTIKDALRPVEELTARLAEALPTLQSPALAVQAGNLLLAVFLRVYFLAADGPEVRRSTNHAILRTLAEEQREKARAEHRSVKLHLQHMHRAYDFPGPVGRFVRTHRHRRLEDILEAERRMGERACRCHARRCDRYFAAILARVAEEGARRRARKRRQALEREEWRELKRRFENERQHRHDHPEDWVVLVLGSLASACQARGRFTAIRLQGALAELRHALARLHELSPLAALDQAEVAWRRWLQHEAERWPGIVPDVRSHYEAVVQQLFGSAPPAGAEVTNPILQRNDGHQPLPDGAGGPGGEH